MAGEMDHPPSALTRVPPLTAGNLALALLGLPLFVVLLEVTSTDVQTTTTIGVYWALALLVVGIAVRGEALSVADLGFRRPTRVDFGYLFATSIGILLVYTTTPPLIETLGLPVSEGTTAVGAGVGIGLALFQSVTIGVVEEVLFRGYPIERLLAYTDSSLVAGGATWLVFTAAHAMNWPLGSLLQTSLVAAVLTVVYLHRRTLVPVVGAHVLVWVFATLGQFYG
ncbi:CPBP family intramembrane glutamic endopeptidase [Haloarchaeobius sp. FL176]|uniref:CPBP family intramembrane glutamic endopeptidase n=1 Tax=Haloarchaeobius sp. FL176 TaxID=2967129 RepID=UPI0021478617|nr:CPBP family intramembrane glutamic endopeptidase [Haloarchaeobius sp. FL176]